MKITVAALSLAVALVSPLAASDDKAAAEAADEQGVKLIQSGKPREALPYLDRAIRLDPKGAHHYLHRGIAYCDLREYDRSLEDVDRTLALNPRYPQAWLNRGNLCQRVGRYKQAIWHYNKALEMSPPAWLEKMIRRSRANTERNQTDVLKRVLKAPDGDVAKLAREAGIRRDPMGFWKKRGKVTTFQMQQREGDVTRYRPIWCVQIDVPLHGGKWGTAPVYLPLERGPYLGDRVALRCQPGVALLGSPDPLGVNLYHYRLWLEWLYFKSGI
jgi:tetratricopeptide (TPR) repeat protein